MTERFARQPVTPAPAAFAQTQFLHDEDDTDFIGFAPTQLFMTEQRLATPAAPAAAPARPTLQPEVGLDRAHHLQAARVAHALLDAAAANSRPPIRRGWLARLEDALDRWLPGNLGSLLQLFICVSLTMALISTMLPLVDRF